MYTALQAQYPLCLPDFEETLIFSTDFSKNTANIRFNENLSSGSRVVPRGQTDKQKKLADALRNFPHAVKTGEADGPPW